MDCGFSSFLFKPYFDQILTNTSLQLMPGGRLGDGSQLWCLHYTSVLHNCTSSGLEEIVARSKDSNQVTSRCLVLYLNVLYWQQRQHLVYPSMRGAHTCCCPSLATPCLTASSVAHMPRLTQAPSASHPICDIEYPLSTLLRAAL